jgi:predicted transcriptional regulator
MGRKAMADKGKRPTDLELAILKALWEHGAGTVREVWEIVRRKRPIGYTTVLKMLQIMEEKGLVTRDKSQRAHIYRPREARRATLGRLVDNLLTQAFDGSMAQLLVSAFERQRMTRQELEELRALLEEYERSEQDERSDDAGR